MATTPNQVLESIKAHRELDGIVRYIDECLMNDDIRQTMMAEDSYFINFHISLYTFKPDPQQCDFLRKIYLKAGWHEVNFVSEPLARQEGQCISLTLRK